MKAFLIIVLSSVMLTQSVFAEMVDVGRGRKIIFLKAQIKELTESASDVEVKQATLLRHGTNINVYLIPGSSIIVTPASAAAFGYVTYKYFYQKKYNKVNIDHLKRIQEAKRWNEVEYSRQVTPNYPSPYYSKRPLLDLVAMEADRQAALQPAKIKEFGGLVPKAKIAAIGAAVGTEAAILIATQIYNHKISSFQEEIANMNATQLQEKYDELDAELADVRTKIEHAKSELKAVESKVSLPLHNEN